MKSENMVDLDKRRDLETMVDKLKCLSGVLDEIKGGKKIAKKKKTMK